MAAATVLLPILCIAALVPMFLLLSAKASTFERFITIELLYAMASGIVHGFAWWSLETSNELNEISSFIESKPS